ncbi:MAG TPA: tetratricopeptide repeat protein [Gemmataceae bacterium]|nr:tetratricopeptide repeat protein [Gemmataceae bacterium]
MSVQPLRCRDCDRECVFERMTPFPGKGDETTYGVSWRCPQCSRESLDVCPLGPLVPTDEMCLNCGETYPPATEKPSCAACGLPRHTVLFALGISSISADPIKAASDAFSKGLMRHGLAILNLALRRNRGLVEAWSIKCSLLDSLGFIKAKATMLEGALAAGGPPALWVSYAYALQQLERHADAVAAYRRYLEQAPTGAWAGVACCNQANSVARLGDSATAEQLYQQAIALEPNRFSHVSNYLRFLIDMHKWPEALAVIDTTFDKATAEADLIGLLEHRALILTEQNNGVEALESIDAAVARGADSLRTHYLRGRALALVGRWGEAREEILRVLTLDPSNAAGKSALEMIDSVLLWGQFSL